MPVTNIKPLAAVAFQATYDRILKQTETAKPFGKLRELKARIKEGERRLELALKLGKITPEDAKYTEVLAKIDGLKAEEKELVRGHTIPHFALATAHNFLRASRGWGLPAGSYIDIRLPGVFDIAVDLSEDGVPF